MRREDLIAILLRCQREVASSDSSVKKKTRRQLYAMAIDDLVSAIRAYYLHDPIQVTLIAEDILRVALRLLELRSDNVRKNLHNSQYPWV